MNTRATRPAIDTYISPLTEHDSCASHPTTGATRSEPIGGYCETSSPSAMRVTAPGRVMLLLMFLPAPSSATTLLRPMMPDFATAYGTPFGMRDRPPIYDSRPTARKSTRPNS